MTTLYLDDTTTDPGRRRERLFAGDLYAYSARPAITALADFARGMIEEAFAPLDPLTAQYELSVERFVEIFAPLKPAFIHHPRTMSLLREVVRDVGADLEDTYLDVPRLRGVTSDGYLTSGVGFAHHAHRDTWWSAPMAQLNWWLPIHPYADASSMAYHLRYFDVGVENGSEEFDYYQWNAVGRAEAAKHIHSDTRHQPRPVEPIQADPQLRIITPVGGMQVFSPAHLHSTVPNTTGRARFSIDFRTVNRSDLLAGRGAPNVDSHPRGTSLRDFRQGASGVPLEDAIVDTYDIGGDHSGVKVFSPSA